MKGELCPHACGIANVCPKCLRAEIRRLRERHEGWAETVNRMELELQEKAADAERGRAFVHRLFELDRLSPEWEQALADLRAWSMAAWNEDSRA